MAASGSPTLDAMLEGGLELGDNIVWVVDHEDDVGALASSFLAEADGIRRHLCFGRESSCRHPAPADVTHVGGGQVLQPGDLEDLVLGPEIERGARLVLERLDDLVLRWGASEAVRFYRNTCPRLFDRGAIAYWFATSEAGPAVIDGVSRIAQCVFEIRSGQLRVIKAEGRPRRLQGATTKFETRAGVPVVSREHALGRLGEGLRRTRRERNLTQAQMATLAGVTPAAISQAETGRRGLSLDTTVALCEALRIGLDDLLGTGRAPDPILARRDRSGTDLDIVALFDDPSFGPRTFLMRIDAGGSLTPPFAHKGPELILVAQGLVLVDLGDTTPVLRSGDGLRATNLPVRRLTNLADEPAAVFWLAVTAESGGSPTD